MPNFISKVSLPNDEKIYDLKSYKTQGIFYAQVDTTSTSTHFTVTIPELTATEYYDGLTLLLYNGKVTSASGFTINVNGLGAKPSYSNMTLGNPVTPTDPTRDTTIFNINYAMLFVYNSTIVSGGCWICYRGYDNNTNTIGYQVRTNSMRLPVSDQTGRYRLLFTSADDTHYVPANTSSATSATTAKTVNQRPIDPFGSIRYYGYTTVLSAGANVGAGYLWQQYVVTMGYSFSDGSVNLNTWDPVYLKCAPQANGSAIIDATDPYVQTLPTTDDGKIYIYLGVANAATTFELTLEHPIYYYKDGAIRVWTNPAATGSGLPTVTTADNDKVLKVVDGDWAVTNEDEIFKISVIAVVISQTEYSMTADKTYAKIVAALNANKVCQVCLNFAGPDSPAYDGGYYIFNYSGSNSGILNFIMDMPSTQPMSNPTFINGGTNMGMRLTCSTSDGQDTWKLSIFDYVLAPNEVVGNSTTPIYWDNGFQECSLATVASSGSYNDLSNKPTIPSAPGTLNTNNSTAQTVPTTAEALSGAINLHKIAKTGNYGDLQNAPAYNASTGNLSSTTFTGSGAGLTDIPVAELSNVVPLDKGGTGIDGGSDSWHDSDELHPRFVINYGAGFYVYWRGPLDNITSVNDFLASDYFRYAQRETHPILANGSTFIGSAVLFTGAFDSTPDPTRLYFVFPDAIYFNNQFVNGLSCTLVYNEGDGISASVSSMLPSVPKWATILSAVQTELLGKEVTDNKVTSVDSGSSDVQYPSAKLLYDIQQTLLGMLQDTDESKYNITGGEITGDVVLKSAAATDFPALIFQRGTLSDNYNDWRIQDRGGFLRFDQRGNGSTSWSEMVQINTTGNVSAPSFSGSGASLTSLNASNISSGTLNEARLPATVEKTTNKTTTVDSTSTDTQYPSAKAVYDNITDSVVGASRNSRDEDYNETYWDSLANDDYYDPSDGFSKVPSLAFLKNLITYEHMEDDSTSNIMTLPKALQAASFWICNSPASSSNKVLEKTNNDINRIDDEDYLDSVDISNYQGNGLAHGTCIRVLFVNGDTYGSQLTITIKNYTAPLLVYDPNSQDYFRDYNDHEGDNLVYPLEGFVDLVFVHCEVGQTPIYGWVVCTKNEVVPSKVDYSNTPFAGTCSTAAGTMAKTVTVDSSFQLVDGVRVRVYMEHANTNSTPTLNVNGTGAKAIGIQNPYGTVSNVVLSAWHSGAFCRNGWFDFFYAASYNSGAGRWIIEDAPAPIRLANFAASRLSTINSTNGTLTNAGVRYSVVGNGATGNPFGGSAAVLWLSHDSGTYCRQIAMSANTPPHMAFRSQTSDGGSGWQDWEYVLTAANQYDSHMATLAYTAAGIDFTTGAVTIPINGTKYKLIQLTLFNNDISKSLGYPSLFLFNASGSTGYKEGTSTYCSASSTSSNISVTFDSTFGLIGSTSIDITALYRRIS